jgi:peroxiredoxin Q/BCP
MKTVELNKVVPDFSLPSTDNKDFQLSDYHGKNVIIYFYPKDNTPGCTQEGKAFRDHFSEFEALDTVIFGVSRDSVKVHSNFRNKHEFPFHLLSDAEEAACKLFDVIKLKKLYGREYMGIVRSTFLIDKTGILRSCWSAVKVKNHIPEVIEAIQSQA